ncbi:G-protein coupled receptor Mth2-like isoform X2 [Episyrphus balteatus]|uniref:G-protein coupled receptor Mth2-like isoform X2 n=1 Tax=Episyrphus balteatus TaxID=286459 RepID=UPI002485F7A1|nr:G-protein coupled receptor Mth2-like isoform X2 [Episyrphus balteatus]
MTELKTIPMLAGTLLLFTLFTVPSASFLDSIHVPCSFIDTVDLSGSEKFPNGSYSYEGLIVPPHLVGIFEYTSDDLSLRVPAEPHVRGCVCKLRPCVKLCCPTTARFNGTNCQTHEGNATTLTVMNITTNGGDLKEVDLAKKFALQYGRTCAEMYHLTPHVYAFDGFSLFENGTLYRWEDRHYFSKDEFCLNSFTDSNVTDIMLPMNCYETPTGGTKTLVYACMMIFSVPFMLLTIIVYMAIPELRTLHGKSLCCYLLGLCIGYSILSAFILIPMDYISSLQCKVGGFLAYFSFMASFFWVSVISFDLFYNIRVPRGRYNEKKRFILYSIYAWGLALISLGLTYAAQQSSFISNDWKPQIGGDEWCWLEVKKGWSAMIYFFGPIIIIIAFNIVMFVLTALQIHGVQKEMKRMMERNDSQKNLRTEKDRFGIFLRLFIVMGVTWSMEITSYLIGQDSSWSKLFYVTDIGNGIQGFLIFTLFVLKKKVKQYITNRLQQKEKDPTKRSSSTISEEISERL